MFTLKNWIISSLSVIISSYINPGVYIDGIFVAFVVALILGIINVIIRPIVIFLTLPINILTLGLFTFVINGLLVLLVSFLVPGFEVDGFWWALFFSLSVTIITSALNFMFIDVYPDNK